MSFSTSLKYLESPIPSRNLADLGIGCINIRGYAPPKIPFVLKIVDSGELPIFFAQEPHNRHSNRWRESPHYFAEAVSLCDEENNPHKGGILLYIHKSIWHKVAAVRAGYNWIIVEVRGIRIASVYFPGRWSGDRIMTTLQSMRTVDAIMGNLNIRFSEVSHSG